VARQAVGRKDRRDVLVKVLDRISVCLILSALIR
jgi:hypothetical protein